jgi:hypothetical protein
LEAVQNAIKLALNGSCDPEILSLELAELSALDLGFDLEITGFATTEIDLLIDNAPETDPPIDPADQLPEVSASPAIIWTGEMRGRTFHPGGISISRVPEVEIQGLSG